MPSVESTPEFAAAVYETMARRLEIVRRRLGRPLTYAEKVLFGHLDDPEGAELRAGESYLELRPDRVAMQDATAQMALLQLDQARVARVAVPTTVHCDHLIRAHEGAEADIRRALTENDEVFEFLRTASDRYGIGFWKPGSGIIHQVVLEHYAFPGGLMIGTDSHTPNAGGLGMFAVGVGGADAVDVMAGFPWELKAPKLIGVRLTGRLEGWAAPKDVILVLCGILTVQGGTHHVIEYFGPGASSISATGKATITNMGAELGATTSIFPFDEAMARYLRGTDRAGLADLAERHRDLLRADPEVESDPERFFHRVIEIDLSELEPHLVGPHTPDLARPVSAMAEAVAREGYPDRISVALIGSCTNSSYEDLSRVADVARQARAYGLQAAIPLLVTPGSEEIRATIERDGQLREIASIGAKVLANACGPCIGQWQRDEIVPGQRNTIVTSFNRNFPRRNDGNPETLAFIGSPEIVAAYALAGRLSFNPLEDPLELPDGRRIHLSPPGPAPDVPARGFVRNPAGYIPPSEDGSKVTVRISPDSQRLQRLVPFEPWDGRDFERLPLLLKVAGKCTTDHISPAGPWLRFRGHLDRISDNLFLGAVNAFTGETGKTLHQITGERGRPVPVVAREYKKQGLRWVVVGDENYGEGSSREHAAMSARYLGCAAVIARSFARIHESNLKKQGVLPLTFADPADYDRVRETDRISILKIAELAPGEPVEAILHHEDGTDERIRLHHSLSWEQIGWFKAGSALNVLASGGAAPARA
jgi:aconitate hydratase